MWSQWEGNSVVVRVDERAPGGSWGPSRKLSEAAESWSPGVAAGAAGATVVWEAEKGWIEAVSRPAGGNWGQPVELSGPLLVEDTEPALAIAPDGETMATWSTWVKNERFVEGASGFEGEWEEPTTLSARGSWAVRATIALDGRGDRQVAWWSGDQLLPQVTGIVTPRPSALPAGGRQPPSTVLPIGPPLTHARASARRVALVKKGKAYVELRCPAAGACPGSLRVVAAGAHPVAFKLAAGGEKAVAVALGRTGLRQFDAAAGKGFAVRLVGAGVAARTIVLKPQPAR